jgi:hypothetical protein
MLRRRLEATSPDGDTADASSATRPGTSSLAKECDAVSGRSSALKRWAHEATGARFALLQGGDSEIVPAVAAFLAPSHFKRGCASAT